MDYFTKWVEAEALANIRDVDVKIFVWKNIVTKFRVPESLVFDNGLQFESKAFCKFCSSLGIKNKYSTLTYPLSNGQAEATNKVIVSGLKKRLKGTKGKWIEELPNILWAYRTTPRRSMGETLYSLTYGAKAVIPAKISLCSARVSVFSSAGNEELMVKQLDSLEECREVATIRLADYQQKLAWQYNRDIRRREFNARDLVLWKAMGNTRDVNVGKFTPN